MQRFPIRMFAFVLLAAALVFLAVVAMRGEAHSDKKEIRWLIAHKPTEVFSRATEVFARELEKETGGIVVLTVLVPDDMGYARGDVPNEEVMRALSEGSVDIASVYTVALGKNDEALWSLSLPFLFPDYETLNRALEGDSGASLLSSIHENIPALRGLAFTMSGGYRILASNDTSVSDVSDLKGLRIATSGGPVAEATIRAFGAVPVPLDLEEGGSRPDLSSVDAVETTYSRLAEVLGTDSSYTTYINETNHSMFLTAIVASERFYQSFTESERAALQKAALAAAAVEREDSIAFAASVRADLERRGSVISKPASLSSFQEAVRSVYDAFEARFGADLIEALSSE